MSNLPKLHAAMRFCRREHAQLRASQLELLLTIQLKPGQTQSELATDCSLTPSAVSRAVDVMGSKGRSDNKGQVAMQWVETHDNPHDERIKQVYLTQKGSEFLHLLEMITYGSTVPE